METAVPPIDIKGLSKRFGAVQAVSDLSFRVEPGRVIGFLGPNGGAALRSSVPFSAQTRPIVSMANG